MHHEWCSDWLFILSYSEEEIWARGSEFLFLDSCVAKMKICLLSGWRGVSQTTSGHCRSAGLHGQINPTGQTSGQREWQPKTQGQAFPWCTSLSRESVKLKFHWFQIERLQAILTDPDALKFNFVSFDPIPLPLDPEHKVIGIYPDKATLFKVSMQ